MWPNDPGLEYFSESLAIDNLIYPGACVLSRFSPVRFFVTLWTIASVHGLLQARILEWVATPSSRGSFWPRDRTGVSCISCTAGKFFPAEPLGKPWGEKRDGVSPEIKLHPESPWIAGCSARTQFMARTCPATAPCPFSSWGGTAAEGTLVSLVRGCRAPGCYGALPTDSPQLRPLAPWLQSGGDCTKCSGVFEIQF